jgi:uncharacterized protein
MPIPFLTAEWRWLVMLNYRVEPALVRRHVPAGTELDSWDGETYISVVGFLFRRTRVLGVPVPFHLNFEEVNLRVYVRRDDGGELRRGVTFIREIVPRRAIATVARLTYNEPYVALPMRHVIGPIDSTSGLPGGIEYGWRTEAGWSSMIATSSGAGRTAAAGSREEFITEHYWGYTPQRDGTTLEYRVDHPRWNVWAAGSAELTGDHRALYGTELSGVLAGAPDFALVADGSPVVVYSPTRVAKPPVPRSGSTSGG